MQSDAVRDPRESGIFDGRHYTDLTDEEKDELARQGHIGVVERGWTLDSEAFNSKTDRAVLWSYHEPVKLPATEAELAALLKAERKKWERAMKKKDAGKA